MESTVAVVHRLRPDTLRRLLVIANLEERTTEDAIALSRMGYKVARITP